MQGFVKVATVNDLSEGEMALVLVGEERILLSKVDGEVYAIGEVCTHAEGPLSQGYVYGDEVECPRHGAQYNLKTGENTSTNPPFDRLPGTRRYAVRVEREDILVGPA